MFIGSPDTTGVTQLLDQINQSLHSQYRSQKKDLFTEDGTINREGFMQILGNMWRNWAQTSTIINAVKRVGISVDKLDVGWMQADKFAHAESCTEKEENASRQNIVISSPFSVRKKTTEYYKYKFEQACAQLVNQSETSINHVTM